MTDREILRRWSSRRSWSTTWWWRSHAMGGRTAASGPRLVRGRGRGWGARVRRIEVVRPGDPVRIANVLDAVLPTSRPTSRSTRSPERSVAWRSPASAAPTGSMAWPCCRCATGWPPGIRNRMSSRLARRHGGPGSGDDTLGRHGQRRGAVRAGAGRAPRRRGPSRAACVARGRTRTRADDDRYGTEPVERSADRAPTSIPVSPRLCAILQVASEGRSPTRSSTGTRSAAVPRLDRRGGSSTARLRTAPTTGRPCAT